MTYLVIIGTYASVVIRKINQIKMHYCSII